MNIEQIKQASEIIMKAGLVPMVWGPPGIGKTMAFKQLSNQYQVEFRQLTTNLLMLEHLTGIPVNGSETGKMIFSRPENIPGDGAGILLIDEITDGMQSIQKMLYSLILERSCNGHTIGAKWFIAAAGNRPGDGSGSSMLPSALITRMVHLGACCDVPDFKRLLPETAEIDSNSWINNFAIPNQINPAIIAYIKSFPEKLYSYQATPRTWEMLSKVLNIYNIADSLLHNIVIGSIGPETGNEFFSFYRLAMVLPDLESILKDPAGADLPNETGIVYALSTALLYKADRSNFENIIKYSGRFSEKEIEIYLITSIINKTPDLVSLPGYIAWHNKNGSYLN